jgi:type I restriction enzyme, S subunit
MKHLTKEKIINLPIKIIDGDRSNKYPKRNEFKTNGIPFLNTTNIVDNRLCLDQVNFISQEKFDEIKKGRLVRHDLIMTTRGSIGKVALFDCKYPLGLINAQMLILRSDEKVLNQQFLYYLFCDNHFQARLKGYSSGAAQPQIPIKDLREIEISLPPLPIQKKTSSILSAYDDLIENNTRRIAILEEMAQMIFQEWFVNFRFPGHGKVKMVDSPLGKIPEGWEVKKVGDILQNIGRRKKIKKQEFSSEGQFPIVDQSADFIGGYTDDFNAVNDEPLPLIVFGDHTRVLKFIDFPFVCGADGTQLLYPSYKEISPEYFYFSLCQIDLSNFGYARHFKFLKEKFILIPEKDLLQQFQKFAFNALKKISLLKTKNKTLSQTRDLLLPKLISGELDVSDLDIEIPESDEPELQASAGGIK